MKPLSNVVTDVVLDNLFHVLTMNKPLVLFILHLFFMSLLPPVATAPEHTHVLFTCRWGKVSHHHTDTLSSSGLAALLDALVWDWAVSYCVTRFAEHKITKEVAWRHEGVQRLGGSPPQRTCQVKPNRVSLTEHVSRKPQRKYMSNGCKRSPGRRGCW